MRCHVQFNGDIFAPAWLRLARCSAGLRILISAQWRIQQASQIAASSLRLEDMRVLMKADQTLIVKTYVVFISCNMCHYELCDSGELCGLFQLHVQLTRPCEAQWLFIWYYLFQKWNSDVLAFWMWIEMASSIDMCTIISQLTWRLGPSHMNTCRPQLSTVHWIM